MQETGEGGIVVCELSMHIRCKYLSGALAVLKTPRTSWLMHNLNRWLENAHGFSSTRAKLLIVVWRELGFLDEGRYLDWVMAGGMLEH